MSGWHSKGATVVAVQTPPDGTRLIYRDAETGGYASAPCIAVRYWSDGEVQWLAMDSDGDAYAGDWASNFIGVYFPDEPWRPAKEYELDQVRHLLDNTKRDTTKHENENA